MLEELDVRKRLFTSLELVKRELAVATLQQQLGKEVEEKVNKMQRKYLLQEQLKIIRKELGIEKDDKEQLREKFVDKMKEVNTITLFMRKFQSKTRTFPRSSSKPALGSNSSLVNSRDANKNVNGIQFVARTRVYPHISPENLQ